MRRSPHQLMMPHDSESAHNVQIVEPVVAVEQGEHEREDDTTPFVEPENQNKKKEEGKTVALHCKNKS